MRMIYFYAYLCKLLQFDTMKARLNITIDASLLAEVKKVAFKQKTSVSEIVENYFKTLAKPRNKKTPTAKRMPHLKNGWPWKRRHLLLFIKSNKRTRIRSTYLYTDLTAVNKSSVPR